jgi:hypothetical protein
MSKYDVVPLALIVAGLLLLFGFGYMIRKDTDVEQVRFEQCLAAGMQWNDGDCLK